MRLVAAKSKSAEVELNALELGMISQAFNEVLNALGFERLSPNFDLDEKELRAFHDAFHREFREMRGSEPLPHQRDASSKHVRFLRRDEYDPDASREDVKAVIELSRHVIEATVTAFTLLPAELEREFFTRTGFTEEEVADFRQSLEQVADEMSSG